MLARRHPPSGAGEHFARVREPPQACERVRVAGTNLGTVGRPSIGALQPQFSFARASERYVEEVPKIVRIPGIVRGGSDRSAIRSYRDFVVSEQRLTERKRSPTSIIIRVVREGAPSAKRCPPRMSLHEQLGELRVREQRFVGAFACHSREAVQEGKGIVRVDRAGKRRLDLLT